jgi:excisionase family DNA binding protein
VYQAEPRAITPRPRKQQMEHKTMRKLVSIKEAAHYTGLSPHTIYAMVSQRRIPFVKVARLVKFDLELQNTVMPMPLKSRD